MLIKYLTLKQSVHIPKISEGRLLSEYSYFKLPYRRGTYSAAKAVGEELSALNHKYEIVDPSLIGGNKTKSLPSICYNTLIKKKPSLFGVVYKAGKWYDSTKLVSPIYLVNATHAKAVWKYIEDNKFDAAVCTHLFGMETLTAIRKRLGKYIPSYGILTDYTVVPFSAMQKSMDTLSLTKSSNPVWQCAEYRKKKSSLQAFLCRLSFIVK